MPSRKLTKKQVETQYKEIYSDLLETDDTVAKREAWHNFTDGLYKDGEITLKQYETWDNPQFIE